MIQGVTADGASPGHKITPPRLRNTFAHLNLAIEASLMGDNKASSLDTNQLIESIYKSIPVKYRDPRIKKTNQSGNPYDYYSAIMNYLQPENVNINNITIKSDVDFNTALTQGTSTNIPDIIVVDILDNYSATFKKPQQFKLPSKPHVTYKLDSAIIRDTQHQHFCCLIHMANDELAFDGESHSRLQPFKWKKILNKSNPFTFPGSVFNEQPQ